MKTETVRISKAVNGFIISYGGVLFVAKDGNELNLKIAEALHTVIPEEVAESIELEITLK